MDWENSALAFVLFVPSSRFNKQKLMGRFLESPLTKAPQESGGLHIQGELPAHLRTR